MVAVDFVVMTIIILIAILFVGIGILVLVHVCIIQRIFGPGPRGNRHNLRNRTSLGSASMSRDDLEKLPCFAFKAKDQGNKSPADCAVCLNRFQAGEKCRLLPSCNHSFHAECVDVWLMRAPVCPICRARADNLAAMGLAGEMEDSGDQDFVSIEFADSVDFRAHDHGQLSDSAMEASEIQESTPLSRENEVRESEITAASQERPTEKAESTSLLVSMDSRLSPKKELRESETIAGGRERPTVKAENDSLASLEGHVPPECSPAVFSEDVSPRDLGRTKKQT